jgi:hypothetical protein
LLRFFGYDPKQELLAMWSSQNRPERRLRPRRTRRARAYRKRGFHPRLAYLEDRTVLSTLTVLNSLDSGAGSLRDTIAAAKSGDTVRFANALKGQTITLTSGELAVTRSTNIHHDADGGAAGSGGSDGQGIGGGLYLASGGIVCLDVFTQAHVKKNHASTSNDDIFGS